MVIRVLDVVKFLPKYRGLGWGCTFLSLCGVSGKPLWLTDFRPTGESQDIYLAGREGQSKARAVLL